MQLPTLLLIAHALTALAHPADHSAEYAALVKSYDLHPRDVPADDSEFWSPPPPDTDDDSSALPHLHPRDVPSDDSEFWSPPPPDSDDDTSAPLAPLQPRSVPTNATAPPPAPPDLPEDDAAFWTSLPTPPAHSGLRVRDLPDLRQYPRTWLNPDFFRDSLDEHPAAARSVPGVSARRRTLRRRGKTVGKAHCETTSRSPKIDRVHRLANIIIYGTNTAPGEPAIGCTQTNKYGSRCVLVGSWEGAALSLCGTYYMGIKCRTVGWAGKHLAETCKNEQGKAQGWYDFDEAGGLWVALHHV